MKVKFCLSIVLLLILCGCSNRQPSGDLNDKSTLSRSYFRDSEFLSSSEIYLTSKKEIYKKHGTYTFTLHNKSVHTLSHGTLGNHCYLDFFLDEAWYNVPVNRPRGFDYIDWFYVQPGETSDIQFFSSELIKLIPGTYRLNVEVYNESDSQDIYFVCYEFYIE